MRTELEMRELDYEALTQRAALELHGIEAIATVLDDAAHMLEDEDVKDVALFVLQALAAGAVQTENASVALAAALYDRGVSTRRLGQTMQQAHTTVHRKVTQYKRSTQLPAQNQGPSDIENG